MIRSAIKNKEGVSELGIFPKMSEDAFGRTDEVRAVSIPGN
jgi:hypothetical protein